MADQLEEALTMGTVEAGFRRGWNEVRQQGIDVGQARVLRRQATRRLGRQTADELARSLGRTPDGARIDRVAAWFSSGR